MYIERHISSALDRLCGLFPEAIVTGARYFRVLENAEKGAVICMYDSALTAGGEWVIPIWTV